MTFEKIHSSIRFLALFLALLSGGRGGGEGDIPIRLQKWWRIDDIGSPRKTISTSRHNFPHKHGPLADEEEVGDIEIYRSLFFSVTAHIPARFKFPSKCPNVVDAGTPRRYGDKKSHVSQQNARCSRDCWNITAVFPHSIDRFLYHDSALRRNCVSWEPFVVVVPTYVSRRLIRDNRFYDYVPPRCESADACATFSLDVLWWALLNRITSQLFCGIIKSRRNWNF